VLVGALYHLLLASFSFTDISVALQSSGLSQKRRAKYRMGT